MQAVKDWIGVSLVCFSIGWCLLLIALPVFVVVWLIMEVSR